MSFRRPAGNAVPAPDVLTARMVGIGMNLAANGEVDADIESTLVHASVVGMEGDHRVLAVLATWFGVHHARVNADWLVRLAAELPASRTTAWWAAMATWQAKDRRFARLLSGHDGSEVELLPVGTAFQIARRGEDARFVGSPLRVPAATLRDRGDDVLTPVELVRRHAGYRQRVLMGPTWRADVWATLETSPDVSVAELARRVGCSFATAWEVAQDFRLLRQANEPAPQT